VAVGAGTGSDQLAGLQPPVPAQEHGRAHHFDVERIASGLNRPTYVGVAPGDDDGLWVLEQPGRVVRLAGGRRTVALDLTGQVKEGAEQGLLGMAFHPDFATNGRLFLHWSDPRGDTRVAEFRARGATVDPAPVRRLLFVEQPEENHNGGQLAFGPDGLLYIGLGDGGSGGDPNNNGQTFGNKLAKIWKLDVDKRGAQPQVVDYGLRNPWRFSFDRATGDLYIADVGQNAWEEIDYVPRAQLGKVLNFGWAVYEGDSSYDSSRSLDPRGPYIRPVQVYSHDEGCSVTGGFVYRGKGAPALVGRYFYGDYCSGTIWTLKIVDGKATDVRSESFRIPGLTSFGQDARGGLYALNDRGTVFRIAS
jgi:glucose/arabinose dehydrogenase